MYPDPLGSLRGSTGIRGHTLVTNTLNHCKANKVVKVCLKCRYSPSHS